VFLAGPSRLVRPSSKLVRPFSARSRAVFSPFSGRFLGRIPAIFPGCFPAGGSHFLLFLSGIIERFFKKSIACNHFSDSMQSFFEKRRYDRAKSAKQGLFHFLQSSSLLQKKENSW